MMFVALARIGTTVFDTAIVGEIGPLYKILPAPEEAVPTDQNVSVSLPPVAVGKVIFDAGLTEAPETVKPPVVRATATRA